MPKHTPKPWTVLESDESYGTYIIQEAMDQHNAIEAHNDPLSNNRFLRETEEANRQLIELAPDMLEVLELVREWAESEYPDTVEFMPNVYEILDKARITQSS